MNYSTTTAFQITNPFIKQYKGTTNVILFAHNLIGTVRGKSANGLMMNNNMFSVVAIVDEQASDKETSKICQGVEKNFPIYKNLFLALSNHSAEALVFLIPPSDEWKSEITYAMQQGLDLINTSFTLLKDMPGLATLAEKYKIKLFDLRDVFHQRAYPNVNILERKAKVVYITGTDCGLGKRTAAFELTQEARKLGINATMYATGQTGLMLGEKGTVVDALICEFSNGIVSQQVCQFSELGYELIFVEGQSDIFHPANSAVALSILHGANPDCIIVVHDENRKIHKGFEEDSRLYQMHTLEHYLKTLEMLSLPCGPLYKTIGIATIGNENICNIKKIKGLENLTVADVRLPGGAFSLLTSVLQYIQIGKS